MTHVVKGHDAVLPREIAKETRVHVGDNVSIGHVTILINALFQTKQNKTSKY